MAIVATGGYGRGLLAPGSDIDLLFLLPYKQTPWGESVVEYMLYMLWDLGLKVGHATRTVDQCIKLASADITIRTALLDCRLILGDGPLFDELEQRFAHEVVRGTGARLHRRQAGRARRAPPRAPARSRYRVEPNIKDGKGGLRDLHTLHWLAKYLYGGPRRPATVAADFHGRERRHLPPLRGLPVDRALPSALPHRPGGGAADVRRAAACAEQLGYPAAAACAPSSAS